MAEQVDNTTVEVIDNDGELAMAVRDSGMEVERKAATRESRETLLAPYGVDTTLYKLGDMPEATFQQLLDNSRTAYEAKLAAEAKAEVDRIAAIADWIERQAKAL